MIELESISIKGLRSLFDVEDIPIRRPTILTGANDGGKSTTLRAIQFLLNGWTPTEEDFTSAGPEKDGNQPLDAKDIEVEGVFRLDDYDSTELGLPSTARIRRVIDRSLSPRYELFTTTPAEAALRDLPSKKLSELKEIAKQHDIEPNGPRTAKASWLEPLTAHAAAQTQVSDWTAPPAALVRRLPIMMIFSSTDEPDPEAQIRAALMTAYRELLEDDDIVQPIRQAEKAVRDRLAKQADDLCAHVAKRCPELKSINVAPNVTFREGFGSVSVSASRPGGIDIPLDQSGAGRRRRVNLAVWEWTGELLQPRTPESRAVLIAYDEPDTHLDYNRQRQLVALIQEQCRAQGVRMIVATHSLNLIDRVAIGDVVHLKIDTEHTTVDRLLSDDHDKIDAYLASVSDTMGIRNSVLLHERCFVGVEGPTEMQALPILFRLVTGLSLQSSGIALISGNGNDGALSLVEYLKKNSRRLAFIVVDKDSTDSKVFRPDKLERRGIKEEDIAFVGERELEDVFSDEQWAVTANREWPRNDERLWEASDFAPVRNSTKFSDALASAVTGASDQAPSGKPGYTLALVQGLIDAEDLPESLLTVIRRLETFSRDEDGPISPPEDRQREVKQQLFARRAERQRKKAATST